MCLYRWWCHVKSDRHHFISPALIPDFLLLPSPHCCLVPSPVPSTPPCSFCPPFHPRTEAFRFSQSRHMRRFSAVLLVPTATSDSISSLSVLPSATSAASSLPRPCEQALLLHAQAPKSNPLQCMSLFGPGPCLTVFCVPTRCPSGRPSYLPPVPSLVWTPLVPRGVRPPLVWEITV